MIACFECRNLRNFVQVSDRGDVRRVESTPRGLETQTWQKGDTRGPGIYCAQCAHSIDVHVDALGLTDKRIPFVDPSYLDLEALVDEMQAVRSDAEWSKLVLPATRPRFATLQEPLSTDVASALASANRSSFYTHQAQAIDAALRGEHVVQATQAGSGKSLGLVVPVLERLSVDPDATAILIYPLKALANDQLDTLARYGEGATWQSESIFDLRLTRGSEPIRIGRLDGATSEGDRREIRRNARILVTNPDALHSAVLRQYGRHYRDGTSWIRLFRGLSLVVLDELHAYQGVFGSNVALMLRRLRRLAAIQNSTPQFLGASATIGNPVELCEALTGVGPFRLVDDDGAERAERIVLICNPPSRGSSADTSYGIDVDPESDDPEPELVGRIAPQTVAIDLVARALVAKGRDPVRTIVFSRSRNSVFQLAQRIQRDVTSLGAANLAETVKPYAATFLADDRRTTEGELRDGTTLAVISTSALELGIDIPDLSLAVLVGYPGQLSSFRQRAGRVGRRGPGLAVLVVADDPLQQYIARDPAALERLLAAPPEDVVVNPFAPSLLDRFGLTPAQLELGGIAPEDAEYFGDAAVARWLESAGPHVHTSINGRDYFASSDVDEWPDGLRSASASESYRVYAQSGKERVPIGVIDAVAGPRDAFVPAVWTGPAGELYLVKDVLHAERSVVCDGPLSIDFLTRGIPRDKVTVLQGLRPDRATTVGPLGYGQLSIERQIVAYKKQFFNGIEANEELEHAWPPASFQTDGLRLQVNEDLFDDEIELDEAVKALEHVLLAVAPVVVACDPADLESSRERNSVYIYDSFGGGLRLSEPVFDRFAEIAELSLRIVSACGCESGCPSCVMLSRRPDSNEGLSKAGAIRILQLLAAPQTDDQSVPDGGH